MPRRQRHKRRTPPRRSGRSSNMLNFTNFGQQNRRTMLFSFERDLRTQQVLAITIGRKITGSVSNPLAEAILGNENNGWPLENVRVLSIRVLFDARGLGAEGFNARYRVGAFMSADSISAIDSTKILANLEQFGGTTASPNRTKVINVRVGPEFSLGRFGETGANTLVVYQRGFNGIARIQVKYQVLGFPATRVILRNPTPNPPEFADLESGVSALAITSDEYNVREEPAQPTPNDDSVVVPL